MAEVLCDNRQGRMNSGVIKYPQKEDWQGLKTVFPGGKN